MPDEPGYVPLSGLPEFEIPENQEPQGSFIGIVIKPGGSVDVILRREMEVIGMSKDIGNEELKRLFKRILNRRRDA